MKKTIAFYEQKGHPNYPEDTWNYECTVAQDA